MRDPKRIPEILDTIKTCWEMYPDLRLGQLISTVSHEIGAFYIEDDILLERLKEKTNGTSKS